MSAPSIYTNTEIDALISPKSDKSYVDDRLWSKANRDDMVTGLIIKLNKSTTYTKTELGDLLDEKANVSDVSSALSLKANLFFSVR